MNDLSVIAGIEIDRLFEAAGTVRDAFLPLQGRTATEEEIDRAESSCRDAFRIIYHNLFALASAGIEIMSSTPGYIMLGAVAYEFEDLAHDAAGIPFSTRDAGGLLEIAGLILRFFSGDGSTDAGGLFFFLKAITEKNLAQRVKRIYRVENRPMYYINVAVSRYIQSNTRYERRGKKIFDLGGGGCEAAREATPEELVSLCSTVVKPSDNPGRVVDCIFDSLSGQHRYGNSLHISTLRKAVYELLSENFRIRHPGSAGRDPMHEYLEKEMIRIAEETLEETVASYGWREGGSAGFKDLYRRAALDSVRELIAEGTRPSFSAVFEKYAVGDDQNIFRNKHMGSFQNFWKVFWSRFLKKFRAEA